MATWRQIRLVVWMLILAKSDVCTQTSDDRISAIKITRCTAKLDGSPPSYPSSHLHPLTSTYYFSLCQWPTLHYFSCMLQEPSGEYHQHAETQLCHVSIFGCSRFCGVGSQSTAYRPWKFGKDNWDNWSERNRQQMNMKQRQNIISSSAAALLTTIYAEKLPCDSKKTTTANYWNKQVNKLPVWLHFSSFYEWNAASIFLTLPDR